MTDFYTKYVALCANIKKSPSAVAEEVGLSRTSPNGWKKGKVPSDVNIQKLADYFNVSVQYLRGSEQQKENLVTNRDEVDRRIQERWAQLTEQEKQSFLAQIDAVLKLRGQ